VRIILEISYARDLKLQTLQPLIFTDQYYSSAVSPLLKNYNIWEVIVEYYLILKKNDKIYYNYEVPFKGTFISLD